MDGKLQTEKAHGEGPFFSDDPITVGVPNYRQRQRMIDEARISMMARSEKGINEAIKLGLATLLSVQSERKLTTIWENSSEVHSLDLTKKK